MSRFGEFVINGTKYDLDDLDLDEMEEIETNSGGTAFAELNFGSSKVMKSIAFTLMRRDHPAITLGEVGKVKMINMLPPDEEMPPLPPGEEGSLQNGSVHDVSGVHPSLVSTAG